jgi:hypothetical protein
MYETDLKQFDILSIKFFISIEELLIISKMRNEVKVFGIVVY